MQLEVCKHLHKYQNIYPKKKRKEYRHCNPIAWFLCAFVFSFPLGSTHHAVTRIKTHIETKTHFNTTLTFKLLKQEKYIGENILVFLGFRIC